MRLYGKTLFAALTASTLGFGVWSAAASGDEPADRARELIERAEQAAADGRDGEARELADRARNVLRTADGDENPAEPRLADRPPREEGASREGRPDGPPPGDARPPRGPRGERPDPEKMKQLQEQFEKARELRRQWRDLEEAGKKDEAAKVREQLDEIRKNIQAQTPRNAFGGPGGPVDEKIAEARKKMQELHNQIREAEKAGDSAKVDQLRQEARAMMRKAMEAHRGPDGQSGRPRGPEGGPGGPEGRGPRGGQEGRGPDGFGRGSEGRRGPGDRIRNIRTAAAMLEQAGFPEEAKKVRELGKQIAPEEARPEGGPPRRDGAKPGGPEGPREGRPPRGPGDRPEGRGDRPRDPDELRARMERIQQEIRRINEQLERMKEE